MSPVDHARALYLHACESAELAIDRGLTDAVASAMAAYSNRSLLYAELRAELRELHRSQIDPSHMSRDEQRALAGAMYERMKPRH